MQTLPFPGMATEQSAPPRRLSEILVESADLLEASRGSDDAEVREASIELAIRSLRAAGMVLGRPGGASRRPLGKILQGPWTSAKP